MAPRTSDRRLYYFKRNVILTAQLTGIFLFLLSKKVLLYFELGIETTHMRFPLILRG